MLSLYVITINNSQGRTERYRLVATAKATAVARARVLAGVPVDAETETEQRLEYVDEVLE